MTWLFNKALMQDYENSRCSPELAEESSEVTCLDGVPYAQLNVMPTPHKFWRNDKMMESSELSRFGLTLRLLTEDHGEAVLMWFLGGFPAKTFPSQEKGPESKGCEVDSGHIRHGSFAKWNHAMCSWKTLQRSLIEDSESFSGTWPKWGSMRDGVCWEVEPLEQLTKGCGYGFWHPTPTARDWKGASNGQKEDYSRWTTWLHKNISHDHYTTYPNPSCSEKVMGWPIGWTELAPLEMGKFQQWQQQHGRFSANET